MAVKTCLKPPMSIISASGNVCSFNSLQEGLPLKSHVVQLTATQSGSGTPSPDNVRSINGYSAINIGSDNKYAGFITYNQLLSQTKLISNTSVNGVDVTNNGDGSFTLDGTATDTFNLDLTSSISIPRRSHKVLIRFNTLPVGVSLFVSGYGSSSGFNKSYFFYKTDVTDWNNGKLSLNIYNGSTFNNLRLWITYYDLTVMFGDTKADEIYSQGELGIDYFNNLFPNDYYAYNAGTLTTVSAVNGSTNSFFTIDLGGTYYGGKYDARTGLFTVTHLYKTYDKDSYWVRNTSGIFYVAAETGTNDIIACNMFEVLNPPDASSSLSNYQCRLNYSRSFINFRVDLCDTLEDFKTWLGNNVIQIVYELTTPMTIQLAPCPINTRFGLNNIFADCGSTTLEAIKIGR